MAGDWGCVGWVAVVRLVWSLWFFYWLAFFQFYFFEQAAQAGWNSAWDLGIYAPPPTRFLRLMVVAVVLEIR